MKKIKRHIVLPIALALYAVVMAVIGYPHYQESGQMNEFYIILAICLIIAIVLHFVLKRRDKNRENN